LDLENCPVIGVIGFDFRSQIIIQRFFKIQFEDFIKFGDHSSIVFHLDFVPENEVVLVKGVPD
jgi:acetyltransferase-like isoleucine patch superfamily enzyme